MKDKRVCEKCPDFCIVGACKGDDGKVSVVQWTNEGLLCVNADNESWISHFCIEECEYELEHALLEGVTP